MASEPDFLTLFPLHDRSCGEEGCEACSGFRLTPRTAAVLWVAANKLADQIYDEVERLGDRALLNTDVSVLDRYPPLTFIRDSHWRRQAARAADDLAEDLASGDWPTPRCTGEEMALHLILEDAEAVGEDEPYILQARFPGWESWPAHPADYDWESCSELFFQDHDVLLLFDLALDGIEDPTNTSNRQFAIGDMRPSQWFAPFGNVEPRDPQRGFRR